MDFLTQVASLTGLERTSHRTNFDSRKGSAVGLRHGVMMSVCITPSLRVNGIPVQHQIVTLLRFPKVADPIGLLRALELCPGLKPFGKTPRVLTVTDTTVLWCVVCKWGMQPVQFVTALNEVATCVRQYAPGLAENRCEQCGTPAKVVMLNGIPILSCGNCQEKTTSVQAKAAREYEERHTDYGALVTFSIIALTVYLGIAAIAGWLVGHNDGKVPQLFVIAVPVIFGAGFGSLVGKHIGRITKPVCYIVFLFALAVALAGHFVFMVSLVSTHQHAPALEVARWFAPRFLSSMFSDFLFVIADIVSPGMAALTLWQLRPQFAAKFDEVTPHPKSMAATAK